MEQLTISIVEEVFNFLTKIQSNQDRDYM